MQKIKAIGFDFGGVIFHYPGGNFNDAASGFLAVDNDAFRHAYFLHNHMIHKGADTKNYTQATEMWGAILSELGKREELDRFMTFVRSRTAGFVSPEVIALIQKLRQAQWKLGLFSNNSIEAAREFRNQEYAHLFDAILFSAEVNCMKPEPEAFLKLASALDVDVSELVFIDDSKRSLSSAPEVGFTPILFTDIHALVNQLNELGIAL